MNLIVAGMVLGGVSIPSAATAFLFPRYRNLDATAPAWSVRWAGTRAQGPARLPYRNHHPLGRVVAFGRTMAANARRTARTRFVSVNTGRRPEAMGNMDRPDVARRRCRHPKCAGIIENLGHTRPLSGHLSWASCHQYGPKNPEHQKKSISSRPVSLACRSPRKHVDVIGWDGYSRVRAHADRRRARCSRDGARFAAGRDSGVEMGEAEQRIGLGVEPGPRQEGRTVRKSNKRCVSSLR